MVIFSGRMSSGPGDLNPRPLPREGNIHSGLNYLSTVLGRIDNVPFFLDMVDIVLLALSLSVIRVLMGSFTSFRVHNYLV